MFVPPLNIWVFGFERWQDSGKNKKPPSLVKGRRFRVATLIENNKVVFLLEMVTESPKIPTEWFSISPKDGFIKILHRFAPTTGSLSARNLHYYFLSTF
jgi:hypothetical protein